MNAGQDKSRHDYKTERGFTLLEILLVMGIMALLTAMVVPSLSLPARPPTPPLVAYLTKEQNRAVREGKTVSIFWHESQLISDPPGETFDPGSGVLFNLRLPKPTGYMDKQLIALFYRDGTAIASDFDLMQKNPGYKPILLYKVSVNPFSGEVIYAYP